jgi:hypothetical protein
MREIGAAGALGRRAQVEVAAMHVAVPHGEETGEGAHGPWGGWPDGPSWANCPSLAWPKKNKFSNFDFVSK